MKTLSKFNPTKKPRKIGGFNVPVEILFDGRGYRIGSILTLLILKYQPISKTLSTAQRVCVKTSCGCSIVKSKAIESTWSRFTPTEPNWTDKPAVINYGDIQHLSGMEPKRRGVTMSKIKRMII